MNEQFLVFKAAGFEATYTKAGKYGLTQFMRKNGLSIQHQIDILGTVSTLDEAKALINGTIIEPVSDEPVVSEVVQEVTIEFSKEIPTKGKTKKGTKKGAQ